MPRDAYDGPRYDVAALFPIVGNPQPTTGTNARYGYVTWSTIGTAVEISTRELHRAKQRGGLTYWQADRAAVRLGYFPWQIWPTWQTDDPTTSTKEHAA